MGKRNLAIAVLAAITGTYGVTARGGGIPGSVAFSSARDGNNEIYVMDPDGADPVRITEDAASDVDPALSPDGRHIVFTSNRSGKASTGAPGHVSRREWSRPVSPPGQRDR
jgi:hypothetical protein